MTSRAATSHEIRQRAGLDVLTWPAFDPFAVDVMVTTRHGGVSAGPYTSLNLSLSVGDEDGQVLENRRRAAAALGADLTDFVFASQVHGPGTHIVSATDRGRGTVSTGDAIAGTDALITGDPGTVLAVLVADCVPIVLYDPANHILACVHAGWRGTIAGVSEAALAAMCSLGSRPQDVIAGIGPAIAPEAYLVGEEVATAVREVFGDQADSLLQPDSPGQWLFDLWSANELELTGAGVPDEQINLAPLPTGTDPGLFFSHRAQRPCGRFALIARLDPRGES